MSEIKTLGPVAYNPSGEYDNTKQYYKLDVVLYENISYVAKQDVKGQSPTNTTYWDQMGISGADLNNYYTKSEVNSIASAKYEKPSSGIPKTDLDNSVQTSLSKADSSLQEHQDITGKEDKSNKITSLSIESTDTQYPSGKCVYDSQKKQDNQINKLKKIYNLLPTEKEKNTSFSIQNTADINFKSFLPMGNIFQNGTPSTDNEVEVGVVTGNNSISTSNSDSSKSELFTLNLGDIELCGVEGTDYQDIIFHAIDENDFYNNLSSQQKQSLTYGNWYKYRTFAKIVLNGEESYTKANYSHNMTLSEQAKSYSDITDLIIFCNYLPKSLTGQTNQNVKSIWYNFAGTGLRIIDGKDLDDYLEWVPTHNLIVYYPVETPTFVPITSSSLIEQLNYIEENISSYDGGTSVSQTNAKLPFVIKAEMFLSLKNIFE